MTTDAELRHPDRSVELAAWVADLGVPPSPVRTLAIEDEDSVILLSVAVAE